MIILLAHGTISLEMQQVGSPTYECGMYSQGSAFSIKDNDAANTNLQMDMTPKAWHYIAFGVTIPGKKPYVFHLMKMEFLALSKAQEQYQDCLFD